MNYNQENVITFESLKNITSEGSQNDKYE